jgi:hypothetical protein
MFDVSTPNASTLIGFLPFLFFFLWLIFARADQRPRATSAVETRMILIGLATASVVGITLVTFLLIRTDHANPAKFTPAQPQLLSPPPPPPLQQPV